MTHLQRWASRARIAALILACTRCSAPESVARTSLCANGNVAEAPQLTGRAPSCIQLVARDTSAASGFAELHRVASSPFTVSVDASGRQLFVPVITLADLPAPSAFGEYSTYIAWAVTPDLTHGVKLGVVKNGRTEVGVVGINQFLLVITAERSADVTRRSGPEILNGTSPSWALQPHDAPPITTTETHAPMSIHGAAHGGSASWVMPAMHPQVPQMAPGLEGLVPTVAPWMPSGKAAPLRPREVVTLKNGDSISLVTGLVQRTIAGRPVTMFGVNGQSPGPMIRVDENSHIVVNVTNQLDQPTSIHWHGVRLENRYDGTPMSSQAPIAPGGSFRYVIKFPDAGIYWYHPHVREDVQQDLGIYGNLFVRSADAGFFAPADREEVLILDDFLLDEAGAAVPYGADAASHALMGRFGNLFLVNGSPDYALDVARGEVVRFFLTNASSTRVFNLTIPGARLKLVGGDVGRVARETWVSSVVIAPAERYIVDVRFDSSGRVPLLNHVQGVDRYRGVFFDEVDTLGIVTVASTRAITSAPANAFDRLRENTSVVREIEQYRPRFTAAPDYTLHLTLDTAQTLPFELWQTLRNEVWPGTPVEWTGTMPMMDWLATSRQLRWVLRDSASRQENMNVAWRFRVGDVVRIRLVNDARILHPMQHPIHLHGQRFLVIAVDGDAMQNLLWKDTALVPAGSTVDLLVEMTNPGTWMLHCHIAEHMESGMHMLFNVAR